MKKNINVSVEEAIASNNSKLIYSVAKKFGSTKELEEAILNTNDDSLIIEYALNIAILDVPKFAHKIINFGKDVFIFYFASLNLPESPVLELADALVKDIDKLTLKEKEKRAHLIYFFVLKVENAPIDKLSFGLMATKSAKYMYFYLRNVLNLSNNIRVAIINALINTKNAKYMYLTLKDDLTSDTETYVILEALKQENCLYICKLILLDKPYSDLLLEYIVSANELYYLLYVAKKTHNKEILELLIEKINLIDPNIDVLKLREEEQKDYESLFGRKNLI